MTEKELQVLIEELLVKCNRVLFGKGKAYSGIRVNNDCLGNFKRAAKLLNITPEMVCFVYFIKHVDAISAWVRGEYQDDTEGIEGRIIDAINYLFLLRALKEEKDKQESNNTEVS